MKPRLVERTGRGRSHTGQHASLARYALPGVGVGAGVNERSPTPAYTAGGLEANVASGADVLGAIVGEGVP